MWTFFLLTTLSIGQVQVIAHNYNPTFAQMYLCTASLSQALEESGVISPLVSRHYLPCMLWPPFLEIITNMTQWAVAITAFYLARSTCSYVKPLEDVQMFHVSELELVNSFFFENLNQYHFGLKGLLYTLVPSMSHAYSAERLLWTCSKTRLVGSSQESQRRLLLSLNRSRVTASLLTKSRGSIMTATDFSMCSCVPNYTHPYCILCHICMLFCNLRV